MQIFHWSFLSMYPSLLVKFRAGPTEFPWTQRGVWNRELSNWGCKWKIRFDVGHLLWRNLVTVSVWSGWTHRNDIGIPDDDEVWWYIKPIILHVMVQRIAWIQLYWICMCVMFPFSLNNCITKTLAFLVVGCQTRRPLRNSLGLWPKAQRTFLNRPYALHMRVTSP